MNKMNKSLLFLNRKQIDTDVKAKIDKRKTVSVDVLQSTMVEVFGINKPISKCIEFKIKRNEY